MRVDAPQPNQATPNPVTPGTSTQVSPDGQTGSNPQSAAANCAIWSLIKECERSRSPAQPRILTHHGRVCVDQHLDAPQTREETR